MNNQKKQSKIEFAVLGIVSISVFAALFVLAKLSPGVEGGMDSYNHYLISRFSWLHPSELLLDQWGKPLYNIFASPFAQFGMMGVVVFNILLLIGTAWLTFFSAKALNFKFPIPAFILALSSPLFFDNTISGLTEPLNAFLLMLAIYWFVKNRTVAAAILVGFLPYARSEGYVIMAMVGFYLFFIKKEYRIFFWLFAGSIIMNFIGWMVEGDPIWVYTSNPYIKYQIESTRDQVSICGHGALNHYVRSMPWMLGKARLLLFIAGSAITSVLYFRKPKDEILQKLFYLVFGTYVLYFFVHTMIWYKGMMGSCGYERVMLVIDPLAALIMAFAFELALRFLHSIFTGNKWKLVLVGCSVFLASILYAPWKIYGHKYPIDISQEQKLFVEAADWYNQSSYQNRMKYFLYPYFNMLTGIDPKDHEHFTEIWSFDIKYAPLGSIVIWDAHFGPNEGKVPLEMLKQHPDFVLIKSFVPETPFPTVKDENFEIHVFERIRVTE